MKRFFMLSFMVLASAASVYADVDPEASSQPLQQFSQPETAPAPQRAQAQAVRNTNAANQPLPEYQQSYNFPKVQNNQDAELAKRFAWWPTDAKPGPVKDEDRSGYWWWPEVPGQQRPWGNQGYIYVRKIIFDYMGTVTEQTRPEELKPSLIIKRIIKNVKVYFDFDKSDLREDAVDILNKAVYTLNHNPQADLLITGNADVRGSEKYNERLGERRADSVRRFMTDHGIAEDRIKILSRGKLDAMAPTHDIVGMQKDRNAQFIIAEVEEVMIPASQAALYQDKVVEEKQELEGEIKVDFKEYTIQAGDTLWGIAKREYGDGNQWKRIYEFNKDAIKNPNKPRKGTRIRIPIE